MATVRPRRAWCARLGLLTFLSGAAAGTLVAQRLPAKLSDAAFWKLVTDFSEPSGAFPSENFLSNESGFQWVIPELQRTIKPGGVYLGVGPEQNFTYIAALRPKIAFIVDIRRQAILQHLLYKALFELAHNRADYLSLLFSRPRPRGLDNNSTPRALFAAYDSVAADSIMYRRTLIAIENHLINDHGFTLNAPDLEGIEHVFNVIYLAGPHLNYSSGSLLNSRSSAPGAPSGFRFPPPDSTATSPNRSIGDVVKPGEMTQKLPVDRITAALALQAGIKQVFHCDLTTACHADSVQSMAALAAPRGRVPATDYTTLMTESDSGGVQRSYLATEQNFRAVRDLESRNLLVPIVGNFGGPKALRNVGQYLRDHGVAVTTFYTSNVEQYLFPQNIWREFYANVAALPLANNGTFIRSLSGVTFNAPISPRGVRLTSALGSIRDLLAAVAAGRIKGYGDLVPYSHQ